LRQAEEICRQNGPLTYVYFPVSGIYATLVVLEDGRVVEASTVGNEGIIGIAAILGLAFSPEDRDDSRGGRMCATARCRPSVGPKAG
jgi:hypothetical protein